MGIVNADVKEILQVLNNIRTAITSIGTTKLIISKRYQQLNAEWKDKKYKELESIVQDCNCALDTILKNLLQGEKYISLLVKSLKEYEETEICTAAKYSLQGTTQGRYLTGGVPPVRFSM